MNEEQITPRQPVEQSATKPSNPYSYWGLVILLTTAILIAITFSLSLLNDTARPPDQLPEPIDEGPFEPELTEEDRQNILDRLTEASSSIPGIPREDRQAMLESLRIASDEAGETDALSLGKRHELLEAMNR